MDDRSVPRTARQRARLEITNEIKNVARRQLGDTGSAGLSLRAVARELGMVSSALYRYFPSRDELLTALIIDAYNAVGQLAEDASVAARRTDYLRRFMDAGRAVRGWAVEHPHEYALIFGSPVPGYRAPEATVDPGIRIPVALMLILNDAHDAGKLAPQPDRPIPRALRADLKGMRSGIESTLDDHQLARGLLAWSELIGMISFELFGQLRNGIIDNDTYFDFQLRGIARDLGLEG